MTGVTTQPASADNEERWQKLLRRAFEVPDIVSDANSETAIAHALRHGFDTPVGSVEDAKAVVAAVVELGGAGKLDELFMLAPDRGDTRATLVRAVAERPPLPDRRVSGPLEQDRSEPFYALIDAVFAKVSRYAADYPFEN